MPFLGQKSIESADKMNNFNHLPFNWFDVLLVLVLILGLYRGRKRGMSLEVFTLAQWLLVIVVCAFGYQPLGQLLATLVPFGLLACYITSYLTIALLVSLIFISLKRAVGTKVVEGDSFGKAEYYVGMPAGMLRFACIFLAVLALLNARYFTTAEIKARADYQKEVYGSEFFPGLSTLQQDVFETSLTGPQIRKYLSFLLIEPTKPWEKKSAQPQLREIALP